MTVSIWSTFVNNTISEIYHRKTNLDAKETSENGNSYLRILKHFASIDFEHTGKIYHGKRYEKMIWFLRPKLTMYIYISFEMLDKKALEVIYNYKT